MMKHRLRHILLISVLAICVGCQPDQRPGDWRVDGGTDVEQDENGWRKLPAPAGGYVFAKVYGELISRTDAEEGYSVTGVSTDGQEWLPPKRSRSNVAQKLKEGWAPDFATGIERRYLLVSNGKSIHRMYSGSQRGGGFEQVSDIGGLARPDSIHNAGGLLVASTDEDLHLQVGPGDWRSIEPKAAYGGRKNVEAVGGALMTWSHETDGTFVSPNGGATWTRPPIQDELSLSLMNAAEAGGDLYTVTDPGEGQRLVQSPDGTSWSSQSVDSSAPIRDSTLTGFNGELYALDKRLRLVRIATDSGQTEIVTDPIFRASSEFEVPRLYATANTLAASIGAGQGDATLSWSPGESHWTLQPAARGKAFWMEVVDGTLLSRNGVVQVFSESEDRWTRALVPNQQVVYSNGGRLIGVSDAEDCLFLKGADGWTRELQWTTAGVTIGCDREQTTGQIVDLDTYRDGYVLARARDYGTGSDAPPGTNQGGLVYWNPTTDEVEFLASEALQSEDSPNVRAVTSTDGQLWVLTMGLRTSDDQSIFHRYAQGKWETIRPDVITRDGQRLGWEKAAVRVAYRMEGYGSTLMTIVSWEDSSGERVQRFGRWNAEKQAFELVPALPGAVEYRQFTKRGPMAAAGEAVWHYAIDEGTWRESGRAFPVESSEVIEFAAGDSAVYVATENGPIYYAPIEGFELRD